MILEEFPLTLEVTLQEQLKCLKRKILIIEPDNCTSGKNSQDVVYMKCSTDQGDKMLDQFLDILDVNLGEKYTKVSKKIYENARPWKVNKLEEMRSPGLVYVSYWDEESDEPMLFLSFMLTEEDGFTEDDKLLSVVYLYEIQILPSLRNRKLGTRLLAEHLQDACSRLRSENGELLEYPLIGIELTVFSDNENAIKFYKSIGMELTPDSPRDRVAHLERRRTRGMAQNISTSVGRTIVQKPIYYLFYLPLSI